MFFTIQDTMVSLEVLEKTFCCDLERCKGCCCIEGDAGAPITAEEEKQYQNMLPELLPYMDKTARQVALQQGIAYNDPTGERVFQIVNGKDCIFARTDHNGWCYCIIEKYFTEKSQSHGNSQLSTLNSQLFKPISCSLYPIRLSEHKTFTGVEYHRWDICHCAREKGKKLGIPIYKFLKQPLIRRFGQAWYDELCLVAEEWQKQQP